MAGVLDGKKILVVDDDRDIRMAIESTLISLGAEVATVPDGNSAVRRVQQDSPDLVVLDMMLPKRSGFLVLERIKREQPEKQPLVIMITGNLGNRHRMYAEHLGVDRYLTKPFRMEVMAKTVCELMGLELPEDIF